MNIRYPIYEGVYRILTQQQLCDGVGDIPRHRHGDEYRLALVLHGEQGPLCIYLGRDDHLQGA